MNAHQRAAFARWSKPRPSFEERFSKRVDKRGPDECWPWLGLKNTKGYGVFWKDRKHSNAHRFAWEIANQRTIPEGMEVAHSCHSRACVNPRHLRVATHSQNMLESGAAMRLPFQRNPEKCNLSKLKAPQAIEIRASSLSVETLAKQFNVTEGTIRDIKANRTWKRL